MSEVVGDTIELVQGDYGHAFELTLEDEDGAAIDVSGATAVRLYFKKQGASELTATIVATLPGGGTDGNVKFTWPQDALADAGRYEGEVEIETPTKKQTVYPIIKFKVRTQLQV